VFDLGEPSKAAGAGARKNSRALPARDDVARHQEAQVKKTRTPPKSTSNNDDVWEEF